jgi:hypothetical protein
MCLNDLYVTQNMFVYTNTPIYPFIIILIFQQNTRFP